MGITTVNQSQAAIVRTFLYRIAILLVFFVLASQLWRLQISQGATLRSAADQNRFRIVSEPALRGVIYDSQGRTLARNRPTFAVAIVPADLPDDEESLAAELERVLDLLTMPIQAVITPTATMTPEATTPPTRAPARGRVTATPAATAVAATSTPAPRRLPVSGRQLATAPRAELIALAVQAVENARLGSAFAPIALVVNLPIETAFVIEEAHHTLPGVMVLTNAEREYLTGALTADLIGYMGPIPAEQAETYRDKGYASTDWVGYAGIERSFEAEMRGTAGLREIEVDVAGREIATIGKPAPAAPGRNLVLTIDMELQRAMEAALRRGLEAAHSPSGAAIAINPQTGAVLGMVSLPTYDNNLFADGITANEYLSLSENKYRPLLNHAISGIYPPGSTFKTVPAAGALQEGVITPRTRLQDEGIMWLPNKFFPDDFSKAQPFYCWLYKYGRGHGPITVAEALAVSCDVFFYQAGGGLRDFQGLNADRLAQYARAFGYGEVTGIDLPGEHPGLVPSDQWKRLTYGEGWVTGDTYNMSIGQGFVLATPLQVANAAAAVANGGVLYRPQLVARMTDAEGAVVMEMQPEVIRTLPVKPEYMAVVREGMFGAVNWANGTAPGARVAGVAVAGKTGTAEFWDPEIGYDAKGFLPTHAWFMAFAPFDNPQIAVVAFIYNGGEGSAVAAPVVSEVLHYFFDVPMPPGDPYLRVQVGD